MDVTLDKKTAFGIEWALKGSGGKSGNIDFSTNLNQGFDLGGPAAGQASTALAGSAGTLGLFVGSADKVMSMLQAYGLEDKANVLSSPVIITSENKSASIAITNQIPITSATMVTQTGGTPVTQSTVEYRDVGIKLTVKPKINEDRFVTMEISQEVSSVVETGTANPRFFTRSAQTNVVVKDKETIIVGGLMSTTKSKTHAGIPYLSEIPVFGKLFGAEKDSNLKSELLIFITPHVIANLKDGRVVTKEFREKLKLLKEETKSVQIGKGEKNE
jgi:general secretion pathway protein D